MARTVKCPNCGGELTVKDENRDFMFCEYCGTKVRLDDYQETRRFVENQKELELKRMEFEEKKRHEHDVQAKKVLIGALILMFLLSLFIWLSEKGMI